MKNQVQLITYVDRIGCNSISELENMLQSKLNGLFGGVHLLPFYYPIDGKDAGFDPIDHMQIDSRLGDWNDLKSLAKTSEVMADLIVNHISAESSQFKDFLEKGSKSEFFDLVLTKDKVFSKNISEKEISKIYRPRPGSPFTKFQLKDGKELSVWTTFTSNQIDIDVNSNIGLAYLENILTVFQKAGVNMIRLDAAGYAIKKAGTSCFMIKETFDFIDDLTQKAKSKGIEVLVEIHSFYQTQIEIAKKVDYVYDFALPVLVLDTIFNANSSNLKNWLKIAPKNVITVLDTHDGIGVVDVASEGNRAGLIPDTTLEKIVEQIHINSKDSSKKATGAAASNLDLYQVNCTYFEALGKDANAYLIARAIQFFVPGIPQVYYVGLFAGDNDMELLSNTNVGRDINRHYYSQEEIDAVLKSRFFNDFKKLILFRNEHSAFNGQFEVLDTLNNELQLKWTNEDTWAVLAINLSEIKLNITFSDEIEKEKVLF